MITMHPGKYLLEDCLRPLELSQRAFADRLGVAESTLSRILSQKADVTPEMAVRLEYTVGRSAEFWMSMQTNYSLKRAREAVQPSDVDPIPRYSVEDIPELSLGFETNADAGTSGEECSC